jgi:hypothetical protein
VVDAAELHPQEGQAGQQQHRHDERDVDQWAAHHAVRHAVPAAAATAGPAPAAQEGHAQRVDLRPEHGEQRG